MNEDHLSDQTRERLERQLEQLELALLCFDNPDPLLDVAQRYIKGVQAVIQDIINK